MKLTDIGPTERLLVLNKEEALRLVHELVSQLADAGGAGSSTYQVRDEKEAGLFRLLFIIEPKPTCSVCGDAHVVYLTGPQTGLCQKHKP